MTYSKDLRIKALKYLKRCGSPLAVGQAFGVSPRTLLNWKKLEKQGDLAPKLKQRSPSKLNNEKLKHYIQEHGDAYLREIAEAFGTTIPAVFYAYKRLKIRHLSIKKREEFKQKLESIPEENRVYIDESGINKHLQREEGRGIRGEKIYGAVSGNRFFRESFIAAKRQSSIIAPFCYTETCNTD